MAGDGILARSPDEPTFTPLYGFRCALHRSK